MAEASPSETAGAPQPVRRRARRFRWAGYAVAALAVTAVGAGTWIESACLFEPPPLPAEHVAFTYEIVSDGDVVRCGPAWLHRDAGIAELYLTGDPVTRGFTMASLCRENMDAQEDQLFDQLERLLPPGMKRAAVRKVILFAYRDLQAHVRDAFELECAAMVPALERSGPRPHTAEFPIIHRTLFYQTLYDTGQSLAEAGLVDAGVGCTSFAAYGDATRSGQLLVARNCDFEAGSIFDDRKLVFFVAPDGGQRYVSVSWAGMLGVVSGVNESGLVVMLHAARTERTRTPTVGTPVPFLIRDALVHDRTVEELAARFAANPAHAAALLLVAEASTGRTAIVETDPDHTVVLAGDGDPTVCANTLHADVWQGDTVVRAAGVAGNSRLREERMRELVTALRGRIDVATAAATLRDRRGVGGADIGLGNRTAISALIAAHAVIYDGADGTFYVSRAPRGLGEFVAYDTARFFARDAADPPRGPDDVRSRVAAPVPAAEVAIAARVETARDQVRRGRAALERGDAESALQLAAQAAALTDDAPEALALRAEALRAGGDDDGARVAAARALSRQPVPGAGADRLREIAGPPRR